MHLTRKEATTKIPIKRKGTKYLVRARSHVENSVPVLIAVREMLNLAKNAKEVDEMIKQKLLKINGRAVKDHHESIKLFNILEAGKSYRLTILKTGKFSFEEVTKNDRLCKVLNKKVLKGKNIQLNLHDGSNVLVKNNSIKTGDSVYLDFNGKITKHLAFEKGSQAFIISGKYQGDSGKIINKESNKVTLKLKEKEVTINLNQIILT